MKNDQTDSWLIHNRINLYLLNGISGEFLSAKASSGGRTVAEQFAHIHNVRLMWLNASSPELTDGLSKLEKDARLTNETLAAALKQSSEAICRLLDKGLSEGRIKGFKPHPSSFLAYLISHESHHRGQIVLSLKQSGFKVDKKILFGLWEWGSR